MQYTDEVKTKIAGSKQFSNQVPRAQKIARGARPTRLTNIKEEDEDIRRQIRNELEGYINRPNAETVAYLEDFWDILTREYHKTILIHHIIQESTSVRYQPGLDLGLHF